MFATPHEDEQCDADGCSITLAVEFNTSGDPTGEPVVFDQPGQGRHVFCTPEHAVATLSPGRSSTLGRQLFSVRMAVFMGDDDGLRYARQDVENTVWGAYGDYRIALETQVSP